MNLSSFEEEVSVFCDKYCRFPLECKSQDELDEHCDKCEFINLINLLQAENEKLKASIKEVNEYLSEGDFAKGIALIIRLIKEME